MTRVLFVCMANVCRSPMVMGVFDKWIEAHGCADRISTDSAGTHVARPGARADRRGRRAALRRGIDIGKHRSRPVVVDDFETFDYILAMDRENYAELQLDCPGNRRQRVKLLLDFAPEFFHREVPDPYYGSERDFENVLDLAELASDGLLAHLLEPERPSSEIGSPFPP